MLKFQKLTKYLIFFILFGSFLSISSVAAIGLSDGFSTTSTSNLQTFAQKANYSETQPIEWYIGLALEGLFSFLGIITMGLIFYSGFVWMTARDNEAKVTKAKDNLSDALIGLLFIVGGYALTSFILQIFK